MSDCVSYPPSQTLYPLPSPLCSRHQQYECKWYIPLADLTFQTLDDSDSSPSIQVLPEHEIEEMKIKISVLKSEIQKEKVILLVLTFETFLFLNGTFQQISSRCSIMRNTNTSDSGVTNMFLILIMEYTNFISRLPHISDSLLEYTAVVCLGQVRYKVSCWETLVSASNLRYHKYILLQ